MNALAAAQNYNGVSKTLHWLIAVLAFSQLGMGKLFDVDAEDSPSLFGWHTTLGLLVLVLMLARIAWRLTHRVPALPPDTPRWQHRVARTIHALFYVLLLALPFTGWLVTSAEGDAVRLFGLFDVPHLPVPGGEASEDFLEETHELLGNLLLALTAVHVLAGLKHHYVDRDNVLRSMLPG